MLQSVVVANRRVHLLLEVQALYPERVLIERRVVLPGLLAPCILVRYRHLLQLDLQLLHLSLKSFLLFLDELLRNVAGRALKVED